MDHDAQQAPRFRILVVCMGNICRSPMAEAILRQRLREAGLAHVDVDSAGTGGWHAGEPAHRNTAALLRDHGIPLDHRARRIEPAWLAERDLVLAMDADNLAHLHRLVDDPSLRSRLRMFRSFDPDLAGIDPAGPQAHRLDVPDPYDEPMERYREVMAMLERASAGLVDRLRGGPLDL